MEELIFENRKFVQSMRKNIISSFTKDYKFLSSGTIGQSVCGRSIDYIWLGSRKEANLWVASHHGMEWITSMLVLKFLRNICEIIKKGDGLYGIDLNECFKKKGLVIIPCLNPDGVDINFQGSLAAGRYAKFIEETNHGNLISWQANARGVDLNHNYSAGWAELHKLEEKNGILKPCSTRFGGLKPISEPETKALTSFCSKNNFKLAIAFHSQGEEIYWDYGSNTPKCSENIANILALSSGYKVSKPEGLAVGGGFKDWFIETIKRPAFTIEIGKGKNPLQASCLNEIYYKIEKMLFISALI